IVPTTSKLTIHRQTLPDNISMSKKTKKIPELKSALDQIEYVFLRYQEGAQNPAELHINKDDSEMAIELLKRTCNEWGSAGWIFPDASVVEEKNPIGIPPTGFRLRSSNPNSKRLVGYRRV